MTYETITWQSDGGVGRLTLNRPEHRNGITGVMMAELLDATQAAAADESLRVVVLTGAGRSFCVGADLKHYSSGAEDPGAPLETFDVTRLLHEMPAVTVAAVNGAAAGRRPGVGVCLRPAVRHGVGGVQHRLPRRRRGR